MPAAKGSARTPLGPKLELREVIDFVLKATTRKGKELPTRREGLLREEDQARIQYGSETLPNICFVDVRKIVRNTVQSVDIDTVESLTARRPQPGRKKVLEEDDQEKKKVCKTRGGKVFKKERSPWKKGRKVCC